VQGRGGEKGGGKSLHRLVLTKVYSAGDVGTRDQRGGGGTLLKRGGGGRRVCFSPVSDLGLTLTGTRGKEKGGTLKKEKEKKIGFKIDHPYLDSRFVGELACPAKYE